MVLRRAFLHVEFCDCTCACGLGGCPGAHLLGDRVSTCLAVVEVATCYLGCFKDPQYDPLCPKQSAFSAADVQGVQVTSKAFV